MKLNYSYAYDSNNFLHSLTDHIADQVTVYTYDTYGNPDRTYTYDSETYKNLYEVNVAVSPTENRMEFVLERLDYTHTAGFGTAETTYDYVYSYATGKLNRVQIGGSKLWGYLTPTYDNFGRTTSHVADLQLSGATTFYSKVDYEYITVDNLETYRVSYMANTIGKTLSTAHVNAYWYEYDDLGNITKILNDNATTLYQYEYDNLGQLVREDNYDKGYSYTYTYDDAGNILSKKTYAFSTGTLGAVISTKNYTYGDSSWGDLLTGYWNEGIGYDGIGNPIVIGTRDSSNTYWNCGVELDWDGRQLKSYQYFLANEDERYYENSFFYQYNADGIRTSKTVDGIEHKYYLNGSQILAETWKQGSTEHLVVFVYDENGSPIALKYRTNAYAENTFDFFFYEKNLQGDIIGIFNTNGRRVGWYIYDAWGVCSTYVASSTSSLEQSIVRSYNPYRYRGYYYDTETQLYYLQSRYYDPAWGRFLNADGIIGSGKELLSYNMFTYCNNSPITYIDPKGDIPWLAILAVVSIVALPALLGGCESQPEPSNEPTSDTTDQDNSWAETDPFLSKGRHETFEEALDTASNSLQDYANNHPEEVGYCIYELHGGYYVSLPQSGLSATETSVYIDITNVPEGATVVATAHSHPWHNESILYQSSEHSTVTKTQIPSFVVDVCGCIYALYPTASNYMDYVKIR